MRAVVQRVSKASVMVEDAVTGAIDKGLLVFLGVGNEDSDEDVKWLAQRTAQLRIFEDGEGRMNQSLLAIEGSALVISQFTLYAGLKKGNRPSFNRAAPPDKALSLYKSFVSNLSSILGRPVPTGHFGAYMQIEAHNEGPVTLIMDSRNRDF